MCSQRLVVENGTNKISVFLIVIAAFIAVVTENILSKTFKIFGSLILSNR